MLFCDEYWTLSNVINISVLGLSPLLNFNQIELMIHWKWPITELAINYSYVPPIRCLSRHRDTDLISFTSNQDIYKFYMLYLYWWQYEIQHNIIEYTCFCLLCFYDTSLRLSIIFLILSVLNFGRFFSVTAIWIKEQKIFPIYLLIVFN